MSRLAGWALNALYLLLFAVASPWIIWSAVRHGKHREGFGCKFLGRAPLRTGERPCAWLHAVSVGEVNLLATTIAEFTSHRPDWEIVVSTTTKTGYDLACKKYAAHTVFYCPLDFTWSTAAAMRRVRPTLLVLAELELWPNLVAAAKRHGARVAIINGRLSDKSFRGYRRIRALVAPSLERLDLIAAQNEETAERFRQLGARRETVHSTGSLKFDGAQTSRDNAKTVALQQLAGLNASHTVFLAGSTQDPEEQYALDIFKQLAPAHPGLRLILVPRHPQRFDEVAALLSASGVEWIRRSHLYPNSGQQWRVLLVDTIGELGAWWGTAAVGFVGGSFGSRGGQNMLEPAAYGVATCFGPNTWNFRDIVAQLLAAEGAEVVHSEAELATFVANAIESPPAALALGKRAQRLVLSQQGATRRTVELLCKLEDAQASPKARSAA
ncbi:3-deoxy-D-manno-octulosonic acid transferase [Lacipirellula sp.]|uniref:3-deoxy-D-manno-octulosonic acid transferase n=1 Tax=Lacipirellula sp. TaxID=2691419 RepID=UPI003D1296D9